MAEQAPDEVPRIERPTGLLILVFLEAFAGVRYLLDILAYYALDPALFLLIALMLVSFLVAYGLWRIIKWAWIISFVLSLFGVISTTVVLAIGGVTEATLFVAIPSIAIDIFVIAILLTAGVRGLFWGKAPPSP